MTRPPIGVFNSSDVLAMTIGIVLAPIGYLVLPTVLAAALFSLAALAILGFTLQPAPVADWLRRLAIALAAGAALAAAHVAGTGSATFAAVNDVLVVCCVIGIANLWVQTGMRSGHLLVLAGLLTAYDVVATAWLPLTADVIDTLGSSPLVPLVFWPTDGHTAGLGLGDLLMLCAFVLVAAKDYGPGVGRRAALLGVGTVAAVLAGVASGLLPQLVPTMAALGPVIVASCWSWRRRLGDGRSVAAFQAALTPRTAGARRRPHRPAVAATATTPFAPGPITRKGGD
jgi:hypothetical protein